MSEELERLRDLWRRELMLRVRLIERDVRILVTMGQTQSSPPSSPSPTATQSMLPAWLAKVAQKLSREALTQFALWLAAKLAMWVAPWLVAWWTMGGAVLRFLRDWAPFLFG